MTSAWQIAGGSRDSGSSKVCVERPRSGGYVADNWRIQSAAVPMTFISKVKNAFLDSLYFLLDGLVHLAFSDYDPLVPHDRDVESARPDPTNAVSDAFQ